MSLVLRVTLGRPLTWEELDANFSGLADGSAILATAIQTAHLADAAVAEDKLANGAVTADKLAAESVQLSHLQNFTANTMLGRTTGNGAPELISVTANARELLNDATFANMRVTLDVPAVAEVPTLAAPPAGMIFDYAGASIPSGYLECDGSNVSRSAYAALFAAVGTTWGAGDGSTTFTLPDLRRRTTIGAGGTAVSGPANTLGSVGGAETHALSSGELASHQHTGTTGTESADHSHGGWSGSENTSHIHSQEPSGHYNNGYSGRQVTVGGGVYCDLPNVDGGTFYTASQSANHQHYTTTGGVSANHTHTFTSASTGNGTAHNNMQPSAVVKKIIKI